MKALLINPATQTLEQIEVGNYEEIAGLIGFDTVIADEIGSNGDKLYFDEECFLRGHEGRFQIDTLVPVSGLAIILGTNDDGSIADIRSDIGEIRSRIKYL